MERYSDKAIEIINELHTERIDYESEYIPLVDCANQCAAYEDTGLTPENVKEIQRDWSDLCTIIGECGGIGRVRELVKANNEGRMVVLPCKVGDTVYFLDHVFNGESEEWKIGRRAIDGYGGNRLNPLWLISKCPYEIHFYPSEIGKTVFQTREEAEKALEAMKNE